MDYASRPDAAQGLDLLASIKTPADVKALSKDALLKLCEESREFLLRSVQRAPGF